MVTYLLAGALHDVCDVAATGSGHGIIAISAGHDTDSSNSAIAVEHHCHGCFAVSVPVPVPAAAIAEVTDAILPQPTTRASGLVPVIEPPPPKSLA